MSLPRRDNLLPSISLGFCFSTIFHYLHQTTSFTTTHPYITYDRTCKSLHECPLQYSLTLFTVMASSTMGTMITNKPLQDRANTFPTAFTDPFEPSRSAESTKANTQHKRHQSYDGSAAEAYPDGVNIRKLPIASKPTCVRDLYEDCISPRTSTCAPVSNLDGWFSFSDGNERRNESDGDVCEEHCRHPEDYKK